MHGRAAADCSLRGAFQFANANSDTEIILPPTLTSCRSTATAAVGCDGNTVGDLAQNTTVTLTAAGELQPQIRQTGTGPASDRRPCKCMTSPHAEPRLHFSGVTLSEVARGNRTVQGSAIGAGGPAYRGEKGNVLTLTNVVLLTTSDGVWFGKYGAGACSGQAET